MQISTASRDFVVDVLVPEVRQEMQILNESFTDPEVVKLFHGADWDIKWLQRDFGIYVVNMFDTYQVGYQQCKCCCNANAAAAAAACKQQHRNCPVIPWLFLLLISPRPASH